MDSSPSFLQLKFQFPTVITKSSVVFVKSGLVFVAGRTAPRALWSFSKNSPLFSEESEPP